MARHNWELIEEVYIAGKMDKATGESMDYSYGDICRMFNIGSKNTVQRHAIKDNWLAKREQYKQELNDTIIKRLRELNIESFVDFRKRLMKIGLRELVNYGKRLEADEVDLKPVDIHRTREWLLGEYHLLFGVPQETIAPPTEEVKDEKPIQIEMKVKNPHDLLRRTTRLLSKELRRKLDAEQE